ncbi:MAG: protein kinase, partial [Ktedonobacteraceae bacterium]
MERVLLERFVGQNVGNCHLEQLLSYGQVRAVYQAHQAVPNRPVMLTLLFPEGLPSRARQQFCTRFLREAPALAEVRHPHLVPLYTYGEWEGLSYMVNPVLSERSLATSLRQHGPCTPTTALAILQQITAGLEHA